MSGIRLRPGNRVHHFRRDVNGTVIRVIDGRRQVISVAFDGASDGARLTETTCLSTDVARLPGTGNIRPSAKIFHV